MYWSRKSKVTSEEGPSTQAEGQQPQRPRDSTEPWGPPEVGEVRVYPVAREGEGLGLVGSIGRIWEVCWSPGGQ